MANPGNLRRSPLLGMSAKTRFWANVSLPDANGCMLWRQSLDSNGYGEFRIKGIRSRAIRFSLTLAEGPAPRPRMDAAHSCRNRHCVAPAHLRWATRLENEQDKLRDGTRAQGECVGSAKLTAEQVREIRTRLRAEKPPSRRALAAEYGVAQSQISAVANNQSWRSVEGGSDVR